MTLSHTGMPKSELAALSHILFTEPSIRSFKLFEPQYFWEILTDRGTGYQMQ